MCTSFTSTYRAPYTMNLVMFEPIFRITCSPFWVYKRLMTLIEFSDRTVCPSSFLYSEHKCISISVVKESLLFFDSESIISTRITAAYCVRT